MGFTKSRLPRKDGVFEDRIQALWREIRRLKEAKDYLKGKHKEKYPNAIYSDDECEYYYMYHSSNSDDLLIDTTNFVSRYAQARLDAQLARECRQDGPWVPVGPWVEDVGPPVDGEELEAFWRWE